MQSTVLWAQRGEGGFAGEHFPEVRAVARIRRPSWLAVAVTAESRISSLEQVREQRIPVRVLFDDLEAVGSGLPQRLLGHYQLSRQVIEGWGGAFHAMGVPYGAYVRAHEVDLIIGQVYLGYTAMARHWHEASILLNLRFLDLDAALLDALCRETLGERGCIPHGLMRGLDRCVPSVLLPDLLVYGRADLPEDLAYTVARAYDEGRAAFLETRLHLAYDPGVVWQTAIPPHPGAARYYREKGYMAS